MTVLLTTYDNCRFRCYALDGEIFKRIKVPKDLLEELSLADTETAQASLGMQLIPYIEKGLGKDITDITVWSCIDGEVIGG